MSTNYAKYYKINAARTNPNKCLLKLPSSANSRYGWSSSFKDVLMSYFNQLWFTDKGVTENILFKYLSSVVKHTKFDFDNYSSVGENELYQNPFKELKATHEACTVNIYAERIYTNFNSTVLDYHGKHVSVLATVYSHPDYLKALEYPKQERSNYSYYYRRNNMVNESEFEKFANQMLNQKKLKDADNAAILESFNHFVEHISKQSLYSPDELNTSYRDTSFINLIFSLYLEYFLFNDDVESINKLFEVFHTVGNTKAKTFNKYLKKKDDTDTFTERPIGNYLHSNVINSSKAPLDELYYYINFYQQFENGKFANRIVSDGMIQTYIMAFKAFADQKMPLKKEYYTLFNKIKDTEVYPLETFEQMNMLVASQLSGSQALDVLEQNFAMLELCLNSDVYGSRWSSDVYNIFTHIEYKDKLNDSQKVRYWKMVANFVNNTKFKNTRIKKILNDIGRLLDITTGDIITKLQPLVINIKQPILLEMYLE